MKDEGREKEGRGTKKDREIEKARRSED